MALRGRFVLFPGRSEAEGGSIIIPNMIVDEGEDAFLKMLLRDDQTIVAGDGNFYMGMCDQVPNETDTLASIATEPTVTNGYERKAITRNAAGWPTIQLADNGDVVAVSAVVTFTPVGGPFSRAFSRMFLCNAAAGSGGTLFAISTPLPAAITPDVGGPIPARYELYLN